MTPAIIIIAILFIITIFFIPKDIMQKYRLIILLAPIFLIAIALFVAFFVFNRKGKIDILQEGRKKAIIELKEAEKQFLQHKIDKKTFDSISQEKNTALIKTESEIDSFKKINLPSEDIKKIELVSSSKKKILLGLLEEKQLKVHELKLSEQSYLKRKIDENTFQNIASNIKKEIISIDAQIKAIQESEEIDKLKEQLKEGAREITRQKRASATRENTTMSPKEELEEEIFEQAPRF